MHRTSDAIVCILNEQDPVRRIVLRMAGNNNLLAEFGELSLDIRYRVRVYWLEKILLEMNVKGLLELSPGVRSTLITYDSMTLPLSRLVEVVKMAEAGIDAREAQAIPSRTVRLPIAFHDRWCLEYVGKYMESVRAEAPYLPDNMEFVARCNGLSGIKEVEQYFLATEHLVIGLGDVYLGAPCAVPLDPRYRMSAPKYNPARTMTPEGAVGIGGAFMCIYPMESPGGYQLIGRTVPIWDTWQLGAAFREAPWLLRPFDRIRFEAVSEAELEQMREAVRSNRYQFAIEDGLFRLSAYQQFLAGIQAEADAFRAKQSRAVARATEGY